MPGTSPGMTGEKASRAADYHCRHDDREFAFGWTVLNISATSVVDLPVIASDAPNARRSTSSTKGWTKPEATTAPPTSRPVADANDEAAQQRHLYGDDDRIPGQRTGFKASRLRQAALYATVNVQTIDLDAGLVGRAWNSTSAAPASPAIGSISTSCNPPAVGATLLVYAVNQSGQLSTKTETRVSIS